MANWIHTIALASTSFDSAVVSRLCRACKDFLFTLLRGYPPKTMAERAECTGYTDIYTLTRNIHGAGTEFWLRTYEANLNTLTNNHRMCSIRFSTLLCVQPSNVSEMWSWIHDWRQCRIFSLQSAQSFRRHYTAMQLFLLKTLIKQKNRVCTCFCIFNVNHHRCFTQVTHLRSHGVLGIAQVATSRAETLDRADYTTPMAPYGHFFNRPQK